MKSNWKTKKLKDVAEIVTGTTPSKSNKSYYGGNLPLVKPTQLQNKYITTASEYLTEYGWKASRWLPENSTLVTCIGELGRTGLAKYPVAFNQQINGVKFNEEIHYKYGYYFLQSPIARDHYNRQASATTVSILNKSKFSTLNILYPEKSQQISISQKLDTLFSKIDAGEESLREVEKQLEVYRQAVLSKAFDNPKHVKIRLGDIVAERKERFDPKKPKDVRLYLGLEHISKGTGEILKFGTSKDVRSSKSVFYPGDILYGKLRPYLNKVAIPDKEGICSTDILVLKSKDGIYNEILKLLLLNRDFVSFATNSSTGVQHPRTKWNIIKDYNFFIPDDIEEQERLVKSIKKSFAVINTIKKNIKDLDSIQNLRQSILKKAFSGGIV